MGPKTNRGKHGWAAVWRTLLLGLVVLFAWQAWGQSPRPALYTSRGEIVLDLDPAQSKVHWTLGSTLHTVHGTFVLKRGAVRFDPASGNASGEFAAESMSGESGNESRDNKMHREILKSASFPEVIFRARQIEGKVLEQGSSEVKVHGIFVLLGSEHELMVPVRAELAGNTWKGAAKFSVPYIQWGVKSPSTFFLKADPAVEIELELRGTLQEYSRP